MEALAEADPALPDELGDRLADVWEPLWAIADLAGGGWPPRARRAAVRLAGRAQDEGRDSLGVRLLADIRAVYVAHDDPDHLPTAELLAALHADEEAPWATLEGGSPLGARRLATLLRPYGVRTKDARHGEKTLKGYAREVFVDPWSRYCDHPSATSATTARLSAKQRIPEGQHSVAVADRREPANPPGYAGVADVADRTSADGDSDEAAIIAEAEEMVATGLAEWIEEGRG